MVSTLRYKLIFFKISFYLLMGIFLDFTCMQWNDGWHTRRLFGARQCAGRPAGGARMCCYGWHDVAVTRLCGVAGCSGGSCILLHAATGGEANHGNVSEKRQRASVMHQGRVLHNGCSANYCWHLDGVCHTLYGYQTLDGMLSCGWQTPKATHPDQSRAAAA